MKSPLRNLRERLSLTQRELAALSGTSQGHVSEVERGIAELGARLELFLTELGEEAFAVVPQHREYMEKQRQILRAAVEDRHDRD